MNTTDVVVDFLLNVAARVLLSEDHAGIVTIPYGEIIIALESRKEHRYRYLGWFCISEKKLTSPQWELVDKESHLWRIVADRLPE